MVFPVMLTAGINIFDADGLPPLFTKWSVNVKVEDDVFAMSIHSTSTL